ncbi:MAG: hypothetical protein CFE22_06055 [Cytophagaceae bacterium BCCC1]|nr:MAG: hypothetical protein CFE22_06055 [Cytophagaceae bacterium BCCC1]
MKELEEEKDNFDWKFWVLIFISMVGIFTLPYFVTQNKFGLDFGVNKPNEIADTIGGILSPFIGFISAVLIYFTIKEQIKANTKIQNHFKIDKREKFEKVIFEEIIVELNQLIKELNNFNGSSLKQPNNEIKQVFRMIVNSALFEEGEYFNSQEEVQLFKKKFKKLVDVLELFVSNVKQEESFKKIVKLRMDNFYELFEQSLIANFKVFYNLKNLSLSVLNVTKMDEILLLLRFYQAEIEIRIATEDSSIQEEVNVFIDWFINIVKDIENNLKYQGKFKELARLDTSLGFKSSKSMWSDYNGEIQIPKEELKKELERLNREYEDFINVLSQKHIYNIYSLQEFNKVLQKSRMAPWSILNVPI